MTMLTLTMAVKATWYQVQSENLEDRLCPTTWVKGPSMFIWLKKRPLEFYGSTQERCQTSWKLLKKGSKKWRWRCFTVDPSKEACLTQVPPNRKSMKSARRKRELSERRYNLTVRSWDTEVCQFRYLCSRRRSNCPKSGKAIDLLILFWFIYGYMDIWIISDFSSHD